MTAQDVSLREKSLLMKGGTGYGFLKCGMIERCLVLSRWAALCLVGGLPCV